MVTVLVASNLFEDQNISKCRTATTAATTTNSKTAVSVAQLMTPASEYGSVDGAYFILLLFALHD